MNGIIVIIVVNPQSRMRLIVSFRLLRTLYAHAMVKGFIQTGENTAAWDDTVIAWESTSLQFDSTTCLGSLLHRLQGLAGTLKC